MKAMKAMKAAKAMRAPKVSKHTTKNFERKLKLQVGSAPDRYMSATEVKLAVDMYHMRKQKPSHIAKMLGRDKSTITRVLFKKDAYNVKGVGRQKLLNFEDVSKIVAKTKAMVKEADSQYEVTVAMVRKAAKCKASEKTILKELHKRNIYFRKLREKPVLTSDDKKARLTFAKKHMKKSKVWWAKNVHAFIDNKHWPVYLNKNARKIAAQRTVRGAYRGLGDGLGEGYTKHSKVLKIGGKTILISAGLSSEKVLMWEQVKGMWTGAAAAGVYKNNLKKALDAAHPDKTSHCILEDNDPTGWKSKKGVAAKKDAKLKVFEIPPRSPDLNPCDYGLWKEVDKRMRKQEKNFAKDKKETRKKFAERLARTAKRLPKKFLLKLVCDMRRRCQRLFAAKGGHFEEGGKPTKAEAQ